MNQKSYFPHKSGPTADGPQNTLLLTWTGLDRPGLTAAVAAALAPYPVRVIDLEQIVIHGQLILGMLLAPDTQVSITQAAQVLELVAHEATELAPSLDLTLSTRFAGQEASTHRTDQLLVTVISPQLVPQDLSLLAGAVAHLSANIDRITRIADYPVTAIELEVSGTELLQLRREFSELAATTALDIAVQPKDLTRRGSRLIVMDVDSTLIQDEVIDVLAGFAGPDVQQQVADITEQAMRGELDFSQSLQARVAALKGVPVSSLDAVRQQVRMTPGAKTLVRTLRRLGYHIALVSGGFESIVEDIAAELGIADVRANRLVVRHGKLTGEIAGDIVDRAGKAQALRELAQKYDVPLERTIAIGDGANDLDMLSLAGLGIAFNAKPMVAAAAHTAVNVPYLDTVLFLLGITREQIEAADGPELE